MNAFRPYSVHVHTGKNRCKPKTTPFPESSFRQTRPATALLSYAVLTVLATGCAASHSTANDWFIFPRPVEAAAGFTAHFGGFVDIGRAFANSSDGQRPADQTPAPLPDPLAFAQQFDGPVPGDALLAAGPEIEYIAAQTWPAGDSESSNGKSEAIQSGLLCVRNLNSFLFLFEAGLRLAYCEPASREHSVQMRAVIARILDIDTPAAYPRFSGDRISIYAATPAEIRRRINGEILVSVDGGRIARLSGWRLDSQNLRFAYDSDKYQLSQASSMVSANSDPRVHALPRRFPGGEFYCLIAADAIFLLYELAHDPGRLLVITIQDTRAAEDARAAFALIPELIASHIRASGARSIALSEIYFRAQRLQLSGEENRPDEFFEIASGSEDAFANIGWAGDSTTEPVERAVFLFSHSTRIIPRTTGLRFQRQLRYRAGSAEVEQVFALDPATTGVIPRRSFTPRKFQNNPVADIENNERDNLTPTAACRRDVAGYNMLCANPGISPELARALAQRTITGNDSIPLCTGDDFVLTEYNPIGIYEEHEDRGGITTEGKFVEFHARRACRTDAIYFRVGGTILDPGATTVRANQVLLFVAARNRHRFFEEASMNTAVFSAPALRTAKTNDEIAVTTIHAAIPGDDSRTTTERIFRIPPSENTYWTGTGDSPASSPAVAGSPASPGPFRAVHSLVYASPASPHSTSTNAETHPVPAASEGFSQGPGQGLRPDLAAWNAMSPGQSALTVFELGENTTTNPHSAPVYFDVKISEILPAGGYTNDLESVPGEELIEFRATVSQTHDDASRRSGISRGWELRIVRDSEDPTIGARSIRFPAPESAGYFVFQRAPSVCFGADRNILRFPGLSLPNEAARYELYSVAQSASADAEDSTNPDLSGAQFDKPFHKPNDVFVIDRATYARLNRNNRQRFSMSRNFAHPDFPAQERLTDGTAAISPYCGTHTQATPGRAASFAPFLIQAEVAPRRMRLYSEDGPLDIQLRAGESLLQPQFQSTIRVAHGEEILLSEVVRPALTLPATPRALYAIHHNALLLAAGEFFAPQIPLIVQSVSPAPAEGHVEWIRLCSPHGFSPDTDSPQTPGDGSDPLAAPDSNNRLFINDSNSADQIVPFNERHPLQNPAIPVSNSPDESAPHRLLESNSLELAAGTCALLVDPDYAGQPLPLRHTDRALWTIATSQAIGNGLSSGEALLIQLRTHANRTVSLCSYGRPDLPDPFEMHTSRGEYVSRESEYYTPDNVFDEGRFFRVIPP